MLRSKIWSFLMVGVAVTATAVPASAVSIEDAILGQLGAGPQVLAFDDDTFVTTEDDGGDGTLDVGDRIKAQLIFRNIGQVAGNGKITLGGVDVQPPSNVNELTGYVELEVTGKTGSAATGYTFQFGAWSSGGTITELADDPNAVIALYEDASQNGLLAGMPIPDPTMIDGQLWGVLGLGGPGDTKVELMTEALPDGIHHDESSAASVPATDVLGTGSVRFNLIDQGGDALTDASRGVYQFGDTAFGTDFAGTFDYFGGAGTGADFTAAMELRSTVTIIPLPPAFLAALPGLALMAYVSHRRRRLA